MTGCTLREVYIVERDRCQSMSKESYPESTGLPYARLTRSLRHQTKAVGGLDRAYGTRTSTVRFIDTKLGLGTARPTQAIAILSAGLATGHGRIAHRGTVLRGIRGAAHKNASARPQASTAQPPAMSNGATGQRATRFAQCLHECTQPTVRAARAAEPRRRYVAGFAVQGFNHGGQRRCLV